MYSYENSDPQSSYFPSTKKGIKLAAEKEHRSIANMVEMLIRRHCDDCGIEVTEIYNKQKENSNG
jgi:hypothetical protein